MQALDPILWEWCTNWHPPDDDIELCRGVEALTNHYGPLIKIDTPHATERYTEAELSAMGAVGVYKPKNAKKGAKTT